MAPVLLVLILVLFLVLFLDFVAIFEDEDEGRGRGRNCTGKEKILPGVGPNQQRRGSAVPGGWVQLCPKIRKARGPNVVLLQGVDPGKHKHLEDRPTERWDEPR